MLRVRSVSTGVAGAPYYTNTYFLGGVGDALAARNRMVTFWTDLTSVMRTGLQTQVEQEVWEIDPLTGDTTAIVSGGTGVPASGQAAGSPLPPATQGLIRLNTGLVRFNRRVAGRIFIPGLTVASAADGRPTGALLTTLTTAANKLVTGASPAPIVVWSRPKQITGPVAVPGAQALVSGIGVWNEFAVLRSRRD